MLLPVLANNMQTANSKVDLSPISDIIGALKTILARPQVVIPDLETPYSRFPNTDHSITEIKGQSVIAVIAERQQQLDAVSHEISGLETVMDSIKHLHQKLVEKKDKITQSMNLHKGLGSPLWRLPAEVLSQIFNDCLPETSSLLPPLRLKSPILLLAGICRRWREVAVGMPRLWCTFSLEVDDRDWQRAAFCYNSWLERSQGLPLSLALECYANDSTKLRSLLQPYIKQISSLSIRVFRYANQPELLLKDLPALQELTIRRFQDLDIETIAQAISQLPSTMRSLNVMGPLFDIEHLSSFNPVWAHLTNVKIAICYPNAFLHLLHLCPNLSSLTVRASWHGATFDRIQPLEPFTHPKIQSFCFVYDSDRMTRALFNLFNALSFPNLRALEVHCSTQWSRDSEVLKAFLIRSECPLESLILDDGVKMTDVQRAGYFSLFPSLKVVVDHSRIKYFP
ncbi:hypothetical protein DFH29DRAFT_365962 [Suillus ampliporus]|nr:hypothetical protein DFH29DRAFT_365962 [Suillus ampliporus]